MAAVLIVAEEIDAGIVAGRRAAWALQHTLALRTNLSCGAGVITRITVERIAYQVDALPIARLQT